MSSLAGVWPSAVAPGLAKHGTVFRLPLSSAAGVRNWSEDIWCCSKDELRRPSVPVGSNDIGLGRVRSKVVYGGVADKAIALQRKEFQSTSEDEERNDHTTFHAISLGFE